tara:strand:+ start:237 stop:3365 length:3129 start_codon:yes stop_codon:yes gene_type:complete
MNMQKLTLYLLFFFSGATSLVYESLWIRTLSLGVGSTSASMSMVLSIFFFGLSAGSFIGGKLAKKIKKPIFYYGLMEGLSGIFALLILYPILNFQSILSYLPLEDSFSLTFTIIKFAFVFILLILPTLCMGATLPLLIEICTHREKEYGRSISFLYALNTFGAVFGAFMTSFALIPSFGIVDSYIYTVVISVLVLIVSKVLQEKSNLYSNSEIAAPTADKVSFSNLNIQNKRLLLTISGVVGFSAITAQVVWNKYLGIYFGTNIFGLGIILSIFLFGIALGSYILSFFIESIEDKKKLLLKLLATSCLSVFITSQLFSVMPIITNTLIYYVGDSISVVLLKSILSGVFLLPSTLLFGSILPLIIRILSETKDGAAEATGYAYSINTVGSILGAYLTGLYLVPKLGSSFSIKLSIGLLVLMTVLLVVKIVSHKKVKVAMITAASLFAVFTFAVNTINFKNIIKSAYFQNLQGDLSLSELLRYFSTDFEEFQFVHEGKTAIISLSHDQQDGEGYKDILRLKTNGLNESLYDRNGITIIPKYEGLLGFLPYMFTRNPKSAFVVGYGGGYTVDFLTQTDLELVFVSELEEGIIEASKFAHDKISGTENPILKRKNLNLKVEDARYALAQSKQEFDIIVSQPSHSWLTGVANLFTKEYFEIVNSKLTSRGVFAQWLNLYNISPEVIRSILKTFYEVFPHGYVFTNVEDDEMIIIGSNHDIKVFYSKLQSLASNDHFQTILRDTHLNTAEDFLTNYAFDRETAVKFSKEGVINSDYNAFAEVKQSQLFYDVEQIHQVKGYLADNFSPNIFEQLSGTDIEETEFYDRYLENLLDNRNYMKFFSLIDRFIEEKSHPNLIGKFCYRSERMLCAKKYLEIAMQESPDSSTLNLYLATLIELKEVGAFDKAFSRYSKFVDDTSRCYRFERRVEFNSPSKIGSLPSIKKSTEACGEYFKRSLAKYYMKKKNYEKAQDLSYKHVVNNQNDIATNKHLLALSVLYSDEASFNFYIDHVKQVLEDEKARLYQLKDFFASRNWEEDVKYIDERIDSLN